MKVAEAVGPEAVPLQLWRKADPVASERWIARQFEVVNVMTGSQAGEEEIVLWSELVAFGWRYSCEGLVQALYDGLNSGKIYGRLTYPVISEWLNAYEQKIAGVTEAEAARHKFRDNGGKDYLDRLEAGSDAAKARAANERVRELERKLRNT